MKVFSCCLLLLCSYLGMAESRVTYCPTPVIKNGKFRYRHRAKFVKYTCNVGFILYGDRYNNCHHGNWDGPPPKCVRQGCSKVKPPTNGMIYPSHMWSVLHFYCKSGYEVHGPNVTFCDGKSWSSNMPICLAVHSKPPLTCDFEQPDLCGWTHDLNHDFDWRRMQFSTPSGAIGTGPSHDHTLGSGRAGFYMYIESSSRNVNDTARLVSPVYPKTTESTCFVFFYHMYGSTIGALRLYLRLINDTSSLKDPFFVKNGNQGDEWIRGVHVFDEIPNDYQIIIEGVRGKGYVSDIAIDDVSIVPNCSLDNFEDYVSSTSTEWEETSTTEFFPDDFYSCEGRCDNVGIAMGKHRKCACDEYCLDRNECCPDYIDFCLIQTSSDVTTETTDVISSSENPSTPSYTSTRSTTTPQTTTKQTTVPVLRRTTTTKILTSTSRTVTEKTITTTTLNQNEFDVFTEDENYEPSWEMTTDLNNDIPNNINDLADIEDVAHLKINPNEKIIISKLEEKGSSLSSYALLTVLCCLAATTFVAVVVRRRKIKRSTRFRSGSHGGSASDVRFLTSDELLDLNLDY